MPRVIKSSSIFNTCKLRRSGLTTNEVADILCINHKTVARRCRLGSATGNRIIYPGHIIVPYINNVSENALAKQFNVSRNVITKVLTDHGIHRRSNTEANREMMKHRTPEENRRNTKAANVATKGRRRSPKEGHVIAKSKERNLRPSCISIHETILAEKLRAKGLKITPQKAVECYNIDIAICEFSIAVEVFGGGWHAHGAHARRFRKRFDLLLYRGWIPVIIWIGKNKPITDGCVNYIISLCERRGFDKSIIGGEHVISGNGKPSIFGKTNLDYRAVVGGDKGGNLVRGKDGRFRVDT